MMTSFWSGRSFAVAAYVSVAAYRGDAALGGDFPRLMDVLIGSGKPVVLVLMNGSALGVNWADQHVPAILEAWYPGEEGGTAVADALAGEGEPGAGRGVFGRAPAEGHSARKSGSAIKE